MTDALIILIPLVVLAIIAARLRRRYIKNRWKGERSPGIHHVETEQPLCALTFDDGPHPIHTPKILDALKAHNAKATFFVVGKQVRKHPEILKRIQREGHAIGNHTQNHTRLSFCSYKQMMREVNDCQQSIAAVTNQQTDLLRPPHGRLMGEQVPLLQQQHPWKIIKWDICTYDWELTTTQALLDNTIPHLKPGSIILLHDIQANTAQSIDALIQAIQAKGYSLPTIPELLTHNS